MLHVTTQPDAYVRGRFFRFAPLVGPFQILDHRPTDPELQILPDSSIGLQGSDAVFEKDYGGLDGCFGGEEDRQT